MFWTHDGVTDATWEASTLLLWTELEPFMYLVAACLPTYRPLLKLLFRIKAPSTEIVSSSQKRSNGPTQRPVIVGRGRSDSLESLHKPNMRTEEEQSEESYDLA